MKTYEKITNLTPDQLHATFFALHVRLKAAANDISDRSYRRGSGPVVMDDQPVVTPPPAITCPTALTAVIDPNTYGLRYADPACNAGSISTHGIARTYQSRDYVDIVTATPAAYVAAILAGEEWVSAWEQLARRYAADTEAAIAAHISAQYEASIKLAGLVLAKQK